VIQSVLVLACVVHRRCRSVNIGRSIAKITTEQHTTMGNRHHHKKQRARVRAVMAETGESYQRVLSRLRAAKAAKAHAGSDIDLLCVDYFGTRVAIATFEILESLSCVVLPNSRLPLVASAIPKSPLFALARPRIKH